jgi:hypothetical protein
MNNPKARQQNKTAYIEFILDELNKGNVERAKVFNIWQTDQNSPNPTLSLTQFKVYWKQANEIYLKQRQAINSVKLDEAINQEKEAIKTAEYYRKKILDKMEEILEQKPKRIEGQVVMPTYADTVRASERIARIIGIDDVKKIQHSGDPSNPLQVEQVTIFKIPENKRDER